MKAFLLCLFVPFASLARAAGDDPRIYIQLVLRPDELLLGTAQRHAQESATIVYPGRADPVVVVIKPLRRENDVLIGIRFYRELSDVRLPAEGLNYIVARWDAPMKISFDGVDYLVTASLKGWSHAGKKPNKAPEPTPGAVTPRVRGSARDFEWRGGARVAPASVVARLCGWANQ